MMPRPAFMAFKSAALGAADKITKADEFALPLLKKLRLLQIGLRQHNPGAVSNRMHERVLRHAFQHLFALDSSSHPPFQPPLAHLLSYQSRFFLWQDVSRAFFYSQQVLHR